MSKRNPHSTWQPDKKVDPKIRKKERKKQRKAAAKHDRRRKAGLDD